VQLCTGQSLVQLEKYKDAYPDDDKIILLKSEEIVFEIVEDKLVAKSTTYEESLWLSDKANFQRKDAVSFGLFDQLVSISAQTLVPYKNKYKELKVDNFTYSDYIESGVFHDDLKLVTFNYPNLVKGSRTIKEYTNKIDDPHFLTGFFFGSGYPVETAMLKITIPESVKMNFRIFNCDSTSVSYSESKMGREIVYIWKANSIKKIPNEEGSPGIKCLTPHIIYYIERYISPDGKKHKVFSNTDDLHEWYAGMNGEIKIENESELIKIVDSLTKSAVNEIDKVKSIYYWVQSNVKYIAVEYGMGGFRPRSADLVFKRRYGDCKDMANLIQTMLDYADIKSSLSWVGTRDLPYYFSDLPTPSVNNHMIVTYIGEGKYYFLDATCGYLPIDLPSSFIQGKEAMLDFDFNNYDIVRIPEVPNSNNILNDSISIYIEKNNLNGSGFTSFSGYYGVNFNSMVNQQSDTEVKENLEKAFFKGSNKYHLTDYFIENNNDRRAPAKLNYLFSIPDYAVNIDSCIFINLNLDQTILSNKIAKDRLTNFVFEFKGSQVLTVRLKIPEGYKVDYIPENSSFRDEGFWYSINYQMVDNSLLFVRKIDVDKLVLNKYEIDKWNDMVNSFQDASRMVVVLKKL
jgi:hypothetical protein